MVTLLGGFRGGGENTFVFDRAVLLEGMFDRVDADLRNIGGDLTVGLRTTPETVRLRTGVGTCNSLDLMDNAEMGEFVTSGCEDGARRCGDVSVIWSCCMSGFRGFFLDAASEAGVNDFALAHQLERARV